MPGYRTQLADKVGVTYRSFRSNAEQLVTNGIVILPGYFQNGLVEFQRELEAMAAGKSASRGVTAEEDGVADLGHMSVAGDLIYAALALTAAALDPLTTALAAYYWGREVYLAQAGGTRLEPKRICVHVRWVSA